MFKVPELIEINGVTYVSIGKTRTRPIKIPSFEFIPHKRSYPNIQTKMIDVSSFPFIPPAPPYKPFKSKSKRKRPAKSRSKTSTQSSKPKKKKRGFVRCKSCVAKHRGGCGTRNSHKACLYK